MADEFTEVIVTSTRFSDRSAALAVRRQGTGVALIVTIRGNRGGERQEQVTMPNAAREAIIRALGGTP